MPSVPFPFINSVVVYPAGSLVDLLPCQWAPLAQDAKHANSVAIDHENNPVAVWRLAEEGLANLNIHFAVLPARGKYCGFVSRRCKADWKRSSQRTGIADPNGPGRHRRPKWALHSDNDSRRNRIQAPVPVRAESQFICFSVDTFGKPRSYPVVRTMALRIV